MKNNLIDLHSHFIFGVDDGAKDRAEALALVRSAQEQGVTHLLATPHYQLHSFPYQREVIEERFEDLKEAVRNENLNIQLYLGCEIYCANDMGQHIRQKDFLTLNGTDFVLLEFAPNICFAEMLKHIQDFQLAGYAILLAHVERYACLEEKNVTTLLDRHCLLQVNASSLVSSNSFLPIFNPLKRRARAFVKKGLIQVVASDMHDLQYRPSVLARAYEEVVNLIGRSGADDLFKVEPGKILGIL